MKETNDELIQRLKQLEEENARLRQAGGRSQPIPTREDEYKGNPILIFERPFRPFSLGLKNWGLLKPAGRILKPSFQNTKRKKVTNSLAAKHHPSITVTAKTQKFE